MILTLSKEEMLKRCRLQAGLEPLRADCDLTVTDGIDSDAFLEQKIRQRYLELLYSAPEHLVGSKDVASEGECSLIDGTLDGGVRVKLPAKVRQVFKLRLRGWNVGTTVKAVDEIEAVINAQRNAYTAATPWTPVAVRVADDELLAWPATTLLCKAEEVRAAVDPGGDVYVLDEAAFADFFERLETRV